MDELQKIRVPLVKIRIPSLSLKNPKISCFFVSFVVSIFFFSQGIDQQGRNESEILSKAIFSEGLVLRRGCRLADDELAVDEDLADVLFVAFYSTCYRVIGGFCEGVRGKAYCS